MTVVIKIVPTNDCPVSTHDTYEIVEGFAMEVPAASGFILGDAGDAAKNYGGRKKVGGLSGIEKNLSNILKSFAYGESGEEFKEFLNKCGINSIYKESLEEIIFKAVELALQEKQKINIIFSPCASSFDQFKNFEDRGNFFKKTVKKSVKIEK